MKRRLNLSVDLGKLRLKNPVMVCSGTFGYAEEFSGFLNLSCLGAIVTKTITLKPRKGNYPPRTCEVPAGMLNSIGLENPGLKIFLEDKLPRLAKYSIPIIVSIAAEEDIEEFTELAAELDKQDLVKAVELNISCPNIKVGGSCSKRLISQSAKSTFKAVKAARKGTSKTLITKLSPNVTDIVEIALSAQEAGSDALALINTLLGMSVDIQTKRSRLASFTGGLSGPAIRPVALRMVWEVFQKCKLPIIGMGGIMDAASAIEFFLVGASAVAVGTANFINPKISVEIIEGLKSYLVKNKCPDIRSLVGGLRR